MTTGDTHVHHLPVNALHLGDDILITGPPRLHLDDGTWVHFGTILITPADGLTAEERVEHHLRLRGMTVRELVHATGGTYLQ